MSICLQPLMAGNSAGDVFKFDATHNYSYTLATATATATATASISGYMASEFLLDTTGFHNALQLNFLAAVVPEPSTYAMMFAGVAAIGAVACSGRRRKV